MPHDETTRERALAWAVRVGDPLFDDWDGFTVWLEESPAHARAYDEVAAAVAEAAELVPPVANDDEPPAVRPVRRRWALGALAASLALVVSATFWLNTGRYTVETLPGEMRTVELADGGTIVLSGDTEVQLDRGDERYARLERGQALFTITHDEKNPFAVIAGEDRLVDAGTIFEVELDEQRMQLAVSEGLVLFNPGKQNERVEPGRVLTKRRDTGDYAVAPVAVEQVGEWRSGRLTFQDAPLSVVAARLSRMTGVAFAAEDEAGGAFSGSVLIEPVRKDPRSLGALLGTAMRREGDRWIIAAD